MVEKNEEGLIKGTINPLSRNKLKIISNQMKKSICKILNGNKIGTGFFCKIQNKDKQIPVFITNYHIINDYFIKNQKVIKLSLDDDKIFKIIKIDKNSKLYSSTEKQYDIMIIKLKSFIDELNNYLEIDKNIFYENSEILNENKSIYILHYPKGEKAMVSFGNGFKRYDNYDYKHLCNTEPGSSGSPILDLATNKLIGIHKGCIHKSKGIFNIGTFLKNPFIELNQNSKQERNNFIYKKFKNIPKCNNNINNLNDYNSINNFISNNKMNNALFNNNYMMSNNMYNNIDLNNNIANNMINKDFFNKGNNNYNNFNNNYMVNNDMHNYVNINNNLPNNMENNRFFIHDINFNNNNNINNYYDSRYMRIYQTNQNNIMNKNNFNNNKCYRTPTKTKSSKKRFDFNKIRSSRRRYSINNLKNHSFYDSSKDFSLSNLSRESSQNKSNSNINKVQIKNKINNYENKNIEKYLFKKIQNNKINNNDLLNKTFTSGFNTNIHELGIKNTISGDFYNFKLKETNSQNNNQNNDLSNSENNNSNFSPHNKNISNNNQVNHLLIKSKSVSNLLQNKKIILKNFAHGIRDIGYICHMNAILQCFIHIKKLTNYFLSNKEKIKNKKSQNELSNSFLNLIENLWENNSIKDFLPYNIKWLINKLNPSLKGKNDIKELVLFLIETLHYELNEVKNNKKNFTSCADENFDNCLHNFNQYFQKNFKSIISELFTIKSYSRLEFFICKHITNTIGHSNLLSFSLDNLLFDKNKDNITINDFLSLNIKREYLIKQCSYCKKKHLCISNNTLLEGPKVLIINIEREKNYNLNIKLNFDENLDLSDFIYYKNIKYNYELIGVITKIKNKNFISFCKSLNDNNWYKYDDSEVTKSSFEEIKGSEIPYLLCYSLIENN